MTGFGRRGGGFSTQVERPQDHRFVARNRGLAVACSGLHSLRAEPQKCSKWEKQRCQRTLSPRAAWRLETLGFDAFDYVPGKQAWYEENLDH